MERNAFVTQGDLARALTRGGSGCPQFGQSWGAELQRPLQPQYQQQQSSAAAGGEPFIGQGAAGAGNQVRQRKLKSFPGDGLMSQEYYRQQMLEKDNSNFGVRSNGRYASSQGFPYHDPAFGCEFRTHKHDSRDCALLDRQADEVPPLRQMFLDARQQVAEEATRKRLKQQMYDIGSAVKHHLHIPNSGGFFDEYDLPLPLRPKSETHHPATVMIPANPEPHGLAYWLS
eukprot:TRINITY_DN43892_c0_g1_i1.p1 TRINITY_DN43892_c0_g1~~TRINITY_DN43892_c0_g1_i1.p1  ORF type:complete len:229 (+),score=43.57 TRINITY_DN43892_c0_g1_i1:82-768(+)